MSTRTKVVRGVLVIALLVLVALFGWVAWTRFSGAGPGGEITLMAALVPIVAAALLFVRRNSNSPLAALGGALALVAALLGALIGWAISFCMCPAPLSPESQALLVIALVVLALAVADLAAVGLTWVAVTIGLVVLWFANFFAFVVASFVVAAVVIRRTLKRPLCDGPDAGGSPPPT